MQTDFRREAGNDTTTEGRGRRRRAGPWTRTAALGHLLIVCTVLLGGVGIVADGVLFEGDHSRALVVLLALPSIGAGLAWSGGRWRLAVAVAIAGLLFFGFLGAAIGDVTKPAAFLGFAQSLTFLVGAPLAIAAGILGIIEHRKHPAERRLAEQRVRGVVLLGLAVAVLASAVLAMT